MSTFSSIVAARFNASLGAPNANQFNVLDFGADPTGALDSSTAFTMALAGGPGTKVEVPAGTYLISADVVLPYATTLEFLEGAHGNLNNAHIILNDDLTALLGPHRGGVGWLRVQVGRPGQATLKWVGTSNNYMIGICQALQSTGNSTLAPRVRGVSCDGNLVASMTMLKVGGPASCSPAWGIFEEMAGYDFDIGVHGNSEQTIYREIHLNNQSGLGTDGFLIGDSQVATATSNFILRCTVQQFTTGIQFGNNSPTAPFGGCAVAVVSNCVIEGFGSTGGVAVWIRGFSSGPYIIINNYFESSDDATHTTTCLRVGGTTADPGRIFFQNNRPGGFAIPFEGWAWNNLTITNNFVIGIPNNNPNSCRFRNMDSGLSGEAKRGAIIKDNQWENAIGSTVDLAGTEANLWRGIQEFERLNTNLDSVNGTQFSTLYRAPYTSRVDNSISIPLNTSVPIPTPLAFGAELQVVNGSTGTSARFFLRAFLGSRNVEGPFEDGGSIFSNVAGTAGKVNVFWDSGTSTYRIENKFGSGSATLYGIKYQEF